MTDTPDLRRGTCDRDNTPHVEDEYAVDCVNWKPIEPALPELLEEALAKCTSCGGTVDNPKTMLNGSSNDRCWSKFHDSRGGAQPEPDLNALVADLRRHYDSDWDTTVPGKEFDAEISRIVLRHLRAGSSPAPSPAPEQQLQWAKNAIAHYLKCGYLPELSVMEAKAFLSNDLEWPNPYWQIHEICEVLKKACDRDWKDETPLQIAIIAANAIYWRGVTGNEGKDADKGANSADDSSGASGSMVDLAAPLASPAVVTPEQFYSEWIPLRSGWGKDEVISFAREYAEKRNQISEHNLGIEVATRHFWRGKALELADKMTISEAKVSELEAQLQQADELVKADGHRLTPVCSFTGCDCGGIEAYKAARANYVRSRRAEVGARMRAGGKS